MGPCLDLVVCPLMSYESLLHNISRPYYGRRLLPYRAFLIDHVPDVLDIIDPGVLAAIISILYKQYGIVVLDNTLARSSWPLALLPWSQPHAG
jgi:hypothetical protein